MTAVAVYGPSGSSGELQFANSSGGFDAAQAFWSSADSKLYISGNLEVLGTQTVIDSTHLQVEDAIIGLGSGSGGEGAAGDRGVVFLVKDETNPAFYWDESADEFRLARLTNTPGDAVFGDPSAVAAASGGYQDLRLRIINAVSGAVIDPERRDLSDIGSNVYFFVSGSSAKRAVFSGDVVISGTLHGGSPLKIGGEMTVAGAASFAGSPTFQAAPLFQAGLVVSGTSDFVNQPKFQSGFEVTGAAAFQAAPSFDAGFNVTSGQASFTEAPSFSQGFQLTGSGDIGGTINIGDAEGGTFADGLFTDINRSTLVGTVVDRFNEVLKALAPGPAPSLDDIDFNNASVSGKLSFGASNTVTNYTAHSTAAGFSAVNVDGTFGSSTSGNNLRIGLLNGSTAVTGDLNEDVSADTHSSGQVNYPANSFGDGSTGTLKLYVNGALAHSVTLSSFLGSGVPGSGAGSSTNGNGSGFTVLSKSGSANFSDGTDLDLFQHRTGRYTIAAADQRLGWNYARVVHSLASGDVNTNYVEWINDSDNNALAAAGAAFDTLSMTGNVTLSGVKYHTAGTANYRVRVTNAYKNVYTTSNITFTETNCSIPNQSMPSSGDDENKVLHLTGSATINASSLLNESISSSVNVSHPLKSNISGGGSQSISGILMWAYSNNSTVLSETFRRENYRIQENAYANQAAITHSDQTWDGSESLAGSDAGHNTGLMFYNQRLVSPSQGANSGNFSGISNGPGSNVNYSSITSGTRTFYRYFQNNSGGSKTGFSVTINGSGTIVSSGTSLNSSRIKVFFKLPETSGGQSTGFMDLGASFSTGQVSDNDGCLEGSLDSSLNATNTVTFGTQFVADDEYIVIKIQADASFTGHISQITVSWS